MACSRCGSVTRVGLIEFLVLQFPVWAWLPCRTFDRWMTCPACRHRTWTSVTLSPGDHRRWRRRRARRPAPGGITGHLLNFSGPAAYALIGFLAFAEAALMVGFFIPGETAVVIGGVLAGLGKVNLGVMIVVVVVCAIVGDSVGFEVGEEGRALAHHPPSAAGEFSAVRYTLGLLERYGGPAVFLGRFIAFARAIIPGLAGMSGLRYRTFLFWNVLGGICWGVGYTLLGYVVGLSFQQHPHRDRPVVPGVVGLVVAAVVVFEVRRRRRERARIERDLEAIDEEAPLGGTSRSRPGTGHSSTEEEPCRRSGVARMRPWSSSRTQWATVSPLAWRCMNDWISSQGRDQWSRSVISQAVEPGCRRTTPTISSSRSAWWAVDLVDPALQVGEAVLVARQHLVGVEVRGPWPATRGSRPAGWGTAGRGPRCSG